MSGDKLVVTGDGRVMTDAVFDKLWEEGKVDLAEVQEVDVVTRTTRNDASRFIKQMLAQEVVQGEVETQQAEPKPEPKIPTLLPPAAPSILSQGRKMPRAVIAGALSAAVAVVGGSVVVAAASDSAEGCRDATHAIAEAGTWDEAAKDVTKDRGYAITVARLLQANGLSGDSDPEAKIVKGGESGEGETG